MKVKLKACYGNSSSVPWEKRGRTFFIGEINAGVMLSESGLTLLITHKKLADRIKTAIGQVE